MRSGAFLRVDERLLHGQVLVAWAAALRPDRIVLANDSVAADPIRRSMYAELPRDGYEIDVQSLADAAASFRAAERSLVVVASPADVLRMIELGARIDAVNLGGLRGAGRRQLSPSVFVSAADVVALRALLQHGVHVEARELPASSAVHVDVTILDRLWPTNAPEAETP